MLAPVGPAAGTGATAGRSPAAAGRPGTATAVPDPVRAAAVEPSGPARFAYDAAGRLAGVTHPDGQSARYGYDAADNVTAVSRFPSAQLSVFSYVPAAAPAGTRVTIHGTGFATGAAANTVEFNGVPATVTDADPTALTVTVPPGATTGSITVRVGTASFTGAVFTIVAPPTITSTSPSSGPPTTEVTVTGTGFDPVLGNDVVTIDGRPVDLISATTNAIRFAVPAGAGSGRIAVASPRGTATGPDFFVPPPGVDPDLIDSFTRLGAGQGTSTVTVAEPGHAAVVVVEAPASGALSIGFTAPAFGGPFTARVVGPDGTAVPGGSLRSSQPTDIDLAGLRASRSYQLVVQAGSDTATGQVDVTLTEPVAGSLSRTDAGFTGTVQAPGQDLRLRFDAAAGESVSFGFTGVTVPAAIDLSVITPGGTRLAEKRLAGSGAVRDSLDLVDLPESGTYHLVIDADATRTGAVTVTVSGRADAGLLSPAAPVRASATRAGQDVVFGFDGATGTTPVFGFATNTFGSSVLLSVTDPSGAALLTRRSVSRNTTSLRLPTLTATGRHRVLLAPTDSATGQVDVTLTASAAAAGPATTGPATTGPATTGPRNTSTPARPAASRPHRESRESAESWTPDARNLAGIDWRARRPAVAPPRALRAARGVTAVSGHTLTLAGTPLAGVRVTAGTASATTDSSGRFLLTGLPAGAVTLTVDGAPADSPTRRFGRYDIRAHLAAGRTTVLPHTIWMQRLDTEHMVRVDSPTRAETVLTNPKVPGLQVRIPAGTVIRDENGKPVHELGITPVPVDRAPYPLPEGGMVPVYFTVQPGGTVSFPEGAQVIYPNYTRLSPGTRVDFIDYDPQGKGWHTYGRGAVSKDGRQVVPDRDTRVWSFNLSAFNGGNPIWALARFPDLLQWLAGDPVDLATGQLVDTHTDLVIDDIISASATRSYWQPDRESRDFGVGRASGYEFFLNLIHREDTPLYSKIDLYLPGGARVDFVQTADGPSRWDRVLTATGTSGEYRGATLQYRDDPIPTLSEAWVLTRRDGTELIFPDHQARLAGIKDRNGNLTTVVRSSEPRQLTVTTPNGRWIRFSYDAENRITQAVDPIGRIVRYTYDAAGRLQTVIDPAGGQTRYTYDQAGRLHTATDARGVTYLTNEYDAAGRVSRQTLTDGQVYAFAYRAGADDRIVETTVTQPSGAVRRVTFNTAGAAVTDTEGYGSPLARTTTIDRAADQSITAVTDGGGRRTTLAYDGEGRLTSTTRLAGTADASTSGVVAYGGPFDQPVRYTDPSGKVTEFTYDRDGDLTTVTDPLRRVTRYGYDGAGQLVSVTDPGGATTTLTHRHGILAGVTDPLRRTWRQFADAAGRVHAITDAAGATSRLEYDPLNQVVRVDDPLGRVTRFDHDANGNLLTLTDAGGHVSRWSYDDSDRVVTATDPLGKVSRIAYGPTWILSTSRAGVRTRAEYDLLGRPSAVHYGHPVAGGSAESIIEMGYDPTSGLLRTLTEDSATTTFGYDRLDRLGGVSTPQGITNYRYRADGLVATATIAGQTEVTYGYDDSGAVTSMAAVTDRVRRQSTTVAYDSAGRQDLLSLPGGWTQDPGYDAAGQLTGITYRHNGTVKGTLQYRYDAAGRVAEVTGTLAAVDLPAARDRLRYDAANRLTAVGATTLGYDADGNLLHDGTTRYSWDARGQLVGLARPGLTAGFGYGPQGERTTRTVAGETTGFLSDGLMPLREQRGGSRVALHSGGLDEWFHRDDEGGRTFLTDALGSTVALGDASGALRTRYAYEPFGAATTSGDASPNGFTYTGREDDGTGLLHFRSRYYSPALQRFISEDPIGAAGGTNLYAYAANSPTNYTDPSGNNPVLAGCLAGAATEALMSMASQRLSGRKVDWGGVGGAAALGCAAGAAGGLLSLAGKALPGGAAEVAAQASCLANSFVAGTQVLMADGTRKPIEQVRAGDQVLASADTDASGARPRARTVETVISGSGAKDLVDLTVDGSVLTATAGHPFWLPAEDRWATAGELRAGQLLRTSTGTWVQITAVARRTGTLTVYNLTVGADRTYYVVAGGSAVLVHNCRGPKLQLTFMPGWSPRQIAAAKAKVAALNRADRLVVTEVTRGASARSRFIGAGNRVPRGADVDHTIDLQLGGADAVHNMAPLNASVNRSLGAQVAAELRRLGLKPGDVVCSVSIRRC